MSSATRSIAQGVEVLPPPAARYGEILTPDALGFVAGLQRSFDGRRRELLERRARVQARLDDGWMPDFPPETRAIREGDWTVAPVPADLLDTEATISA